MNRSPFHLSWMRHAVVALCLAFTSAMPAPLAAQDLPRPVGYVNDFAGILTDDAKARIEAVVRQVQAQTRGDIVVVSLPDLGGRPVEEVSLRLGREWKVGADATIGDAARNAGVVILIVPKETSSDGRGYCRIEVGQGAEGFITDGTAGALCRAQTDRFRAQDYGTALEALTFDIAALYAANFGVTLDLSGAPPPPKRQYVRMSPETRVLLPYFIAFFIFFFLSQNFRLRRRQGPGCMGCLPLIVAAPPRPPSTYSSGSSWGGGGDWGGSSGGFGGFGGGGGFSGGGGGSSW